MTNKIVLELEFVKPESAHPVSPPSPPPIHTKTGPIIMINSVCNKRRGAFIKAWDEYFDEIPKKFKDKDGKEYDHNTPLDLHS